MHTARAVEFSNPEILAVRVGRKAYVLRFIIALTGMCLVSEGNRRKYYQKMILD